MNESLNIFNLNPRIKSFIVCLLLVLPTPIFAEELAQNKTIAVTTNQVDTASEPASAAVVPEKVVSSDFVKRAWAASGQNDFKQIEDLLTQALAQYGEEAKKQAAQLSAFPARGKENDYAALNDLGTIYFIKAEALMNSDKKEEAIALFEATIKEYRWAQAWDPRGWFWSIAEKSQNSVDVMMGKEVEEKETVTKPEHKTLPQLSSIGQEIVDYRKFGEFIGVGTKDYRYQIKDSKGLSAAVGEGIYPNFSAVFKDPNYKKAKEEGRLEGTHWDFVRSEDLEAAFYKWATAPEPPGIKLYYLALILEKAKMYYQALKAYQAIVIHFPKSVGWTYWQTPWYPAQAAIAKIKYLVRIHPELDLKVQWMKVQVTNGFDNDVNNDSVVTFPGIIEKKNWIDKIKGQFNLEKKTVPLGKVTKTIGQGKVKLVQYDNSHWQMLVDGKPYVIHGLNYSPTKVGESPDKKTLVSWMEQDTNKNGLPDGPYDSWVDKNRNNKQDPDEAVVGDFQLMKAMGTNTIREYYQPFKPNKTVLRKMFEQYGIRVAFGNFLGKYTLGSGASWFEGTDYENPTHQKNMMDDIKQMVMEYKDEPYTLMWILGNENNYGVASNADKKPEAYYKFANEVAKMIKSIDPNHPVAVCNGDTLFLDKFAKFAPDVDIFAANVYRGDYGFGSFWEQVFDATGKPAFITEYGSPAYAKHMSLEESEQAQADYHRGNWLDIESNFAGQVDGVGNALGGFAFEWIDEWWKNYEPFKHDKKSDAIGPFPGGYYYEEWFGLVTQGNGTQSPFLRQLRPVYNVYQEFWNKK